MGHYRFYRFYMDTMLKMEGKAGKLSYPKAFDSLIRRICVEAASQHKAKTEMAMYHGVLMEKLALVERNFSTVIIKDMDTVNRIMDFKVTVKDISKLLNENEILTIAVPRESQLMPTLVGRFPPGYFSGEKECGHSHIFFLSNHLDYGGWMSKSDNCGKEDMYDSLDVSHQFAVKLLMYRKATKNGFSHGLPSRLSNILSLKLCQGVERLELPKLTISENISVHEHYRKDHLRQLWADRYYQGEHSPLERGSRTTLVEACVVRRKSLEVITVE